MLHHFGPVLGHHARVSKAGGDHTHGHMIKLPDGGTDGGCQVLLAKLDPQGPDRVQALVGQHLLEEFLGRKGNVTQAPTPNLKVSSALQGSLIKTEAQEAEVVLEPWKPWDSFSVH